MHVSPRYVSRPNSFSHGAAVWAPRAGQEASAIQMDLQMDRYCQREFQIDYQPIVAFDQGQLLGFEALLHLRPERRRWYDDRLVAMVHSTNLGQPVEAWMVTQVCQQLQQWQRTWPQVKPLLVSLNLSHQQLLSRSLLRQLDALVRDRALEPNHLQLEIPAALICNGMGQSMGQRMRQGMGQGMRQGMTAGMTAGSLVSQGESLTLLLKRLHRLGVRLILDDFSPTLIGTRTLSQLPIEAVKISQSLIDFLSTRAHSQQMLETVFAELDRQGIAVITKRIETASQLSLLQTLDRDQGQGFLFHRPVGSSEATALINQERYCKRRSLHSYLRAMTKVSQAVEHWLGHSLVRRYWKQTHDPIMGIGSLGTPMDGLRALPDTLLISAIQEQQLRTWVAAFITLAQRVLRPVDQAIRWRGGLETQERLLLGLGETLSC
jgi:EAL domain-containing protein (putative c-di-GMP-specific phosphodiesterase class I)